MTGTPDGTADDAPEVCTVCGEERRYGDIYWTGVWNGVVKGYYPMCSSCQKDGARYYLEQKMADKAGVE